MSGYGSERFPSIDTHTPPGGLFACKHRSENRSWQTEVTAKCSFLIGIRERFRWLKEAPEEDKANTGSSSSVCQMLDSLRCLPERQRRFRRPIRVESEKKMTAI